MRRIGTVLGVVGLAALVTPTGPAAAQETYRVRWGETLIGVAGRLGVDPGRLAAANGLRDPNRILAGQVLVVPPPSAAPTSSSGAFGSSYRVRPGDTLADLAPRFGVSTQRLATANSLANPNRIVAGQTLVVPGSSSSRASGGAATMGPVRPWRCPVPGARFTNDYGYVKPNGQVHRGVDLYAPRGAPVVAPVAGLVLASPNHMGGRAVVLWGDDGNRYYGAHLDRYGRTGRVSAGSVIGYVGNSGDAAGGPTHLHFELHPGGGTAASPYPRLASAC